MGVAFTSDFLVAFLPGLESPLAFLFLNLLGFSSCSDSEDEEPESESSSLSSSDEEGLFLLFFLLFFVFLVVVLDSSFC